MVNASKPADEQPVVLDTLFTPYPDSSPSSNLVALRKRDSVGLDKGLGELEFKAFFDLKNFRKNKEAAREKYTRP